MAKTDEFKSFVYSIAKLAADGAPADLDALLAQKDANGKSVSDLVTEQVATIGEKIAIRRFVQSRC